MDDPILALAILSLGSFIGVVVTGFFYVSVIRPNWLEEEPAHITFSRPVRSAVTADAQAGGGEALDDLRADLNRLRYLLEQQQSTPAAQAAAPSAELAQLVQQINGRIDAERQQLTLLANDQRATLAAIVDQLDTQTGIMSHANGILENMEQLSELGGQVRDLADKLTQQETAIAKIITDLENLNLPATLQGQAQKIDEIDDHLHDQQKILAEIDEQIDRVEVEFKPDRRADRLTDISGIGPKYANKLIEAGIESFKQLAAFTPDELYALLDAPKRVKVEKWIEQAKQFVAKDEKLEKNR